MLTPKILEFAEKIFGTSEPLGIAERIYVCIIITLVLYALLGRAIFRGISKLREPKKIKTKSDFRREIAELQVKCAKARAKPTLHGYEYTWKDTNERRKRAAENRASRAREVAYYQSRIAILRSEMADAPDKEENENDKTITTINY